MRKAPGSHSSDSQRWEHTHDPECNHHAIQPPFPKSLVHFRPGCIRKGNLREMHKDTPALRLRVACRLQCMIAQRDLGASQSSPKTHPPKVFPDQDVHIESTEQLFWGTKCCGAGDQLPSPPLTLSKHTPSGAIASHILLGKKVLLTGWQ